MVRILLVLIVMALSIYTLIDSARTPSQQMPASIPKLAWILLVLLVPVIGPLLWLYFKYRNVIMSDAPLSTDDLASRLFTNKRSAQSAPVAPDDDPEFLARLDAQNRRHAYEQRKARDMGTADKNARKDNSKIGKENGSHSEADDKSENDGENTAGSASS